MTYGWARVLGLHRVRVAYSGEDGGDGGGGSDSYAAAFEWRRRSLWRSALVIAGVLAVVTAVVVVDRVTERPAEVGTARADRKRCERVAGPLAAPGAIVSSWGSQRAADGSLVRTTCSFSPKVFEEPNEMFVIERDGRVTRAEGLLASRGAPPGT